ncbi:V4R domain-containing protein [Ureibacillus sinduriensis]|uniref:4-vinyl reductase 4VR domain-containing protein n=1 Tax=Ureibacillus sinduriensis BLB-1 = JCM 15800 TaxID=1384057 RepID=A0A0A3HP03_9BACL|nr:V4R domain-containing protein [Ureibacillus sinduriensis]KGR74119.1 hypothetical protein CD33_19195 [Ureibacillus sinduriensis BLB-1 = JCM 15800]
MVNSDTIYHSDKKISTTSVTLGLLRKELISNLGMKRAKAFLLRYGWNLGVAYAKKWLQNPANLEDMLTKGDLLKIQTGQTSKMAAERTLKTNVDGKVVYIFSTGKWTDSIEVKEHIKNFGLSTTPVCHTQAGISSGFVTMMTNRKVYCKEVKCRAMGHDECAYEIRIEEEWHNDPDMLEEIGLYRERSVMDELNHSYEQLIDQKNYIEKISTFHDTLTKNSSEGRSVEELARTVSRILKIPVTIEDLNFQARCYAGMDKDTYDALKEDFLGSVPRKICGKPKLTTNDKNNIIRGMLHNRLIAPIVVQNETIGYMSFIYADKTVEFEKDSMLLQRAASSIADWFLAEKASIKEAAKIKGYLLEQLLSKPYQPESSIVNQCSSMGIDLKKAFYIAVLQFTPNGLDTNIGEFQKQVLSSITRYLEMQNYTILITQYENQLVMLMPKVKELHFNLENIINYLSNDYWQGIFRIGLSNESETTSHISERLEEAQKVLRINKKDPIVFHEETNMIGALINSKNMSTIRRKAQKELQPILQLKDSKRDELLKTMYVFLLNGGNLQQSSNDLSLSMSGLLYRISRIEKLLNQQLRDPRAAYELLLMLDALRVIGDIDV